MNPDERIGGLDPSTKRIGYAAPDGSLHSIESRKLPKEPTPYDLARRCHELRTGLARAISLNPPIPKLMIIEGRFFMHPNTSARLDELRGVIRDLLYSWPAERGGSIEFVEIPPKSLKLFAAGDGTADKTLMTHQANVLLEHAGAPWRCDNDDVSDAYHLRRLGRVARGYEQPLAEYQVLALENAGVVL